MSRLSNIIDRVVHRRPRTRHLRSALSHPSNSSRQQKGPVSSRSDLIEIIKPNDTVLEIGPLTNPTVRGPRVRYFDILDEAGLIKHAKSCDYPTAGSVPIDYVSPTGDLSIVEDESFKFAFSSHCMEHQPNLVAHLNQIERILNAGGRYLFALPDHRYCFDHFISPSTPSQVIEAFAEDRRVHTLKSHINYATRTTHNDPVRHWNGDHGEPGGEHRFNEAAREQLLKSIEEGKYTDCHGWQFTPESFSEIISQLKKSGLISFELEFVTPTPHNTFEFYGSLRKSGSSISRFLTSKASAADKI